MLTACARTAGFVETQVAGPTARAPVPRRGPSAAQALGEHGQQVVGKLPGGQSAAGLRTYDAVCRDRVARYHPTWVPACNDGSAGIQHLMATEQLPGVLGAWFKTEFMAELLELI